MKKESFCAGVVRSYSDMLHSLVPKWSADKAKTEKGTLLGGLKYLFLPYLTVAALMLILQVILYLAMIKIMTILGGESLSGLNLEMFVVYLIIILCLFALDAALSAVMNAVAFGLARIAGGRAAFSNQFFHLSRFGGAVLLVTMAVSLVPSSASLVCFIFLFGVALGLYSTAMTTRIFSEVHGLSGWKALLPAIIFLPYCFIRVAPLFLGFMFSMGSFPIR